MITCVLVLSVIEIFIRFILDSMNHVITMINPYGTTTPVSSRTVLLPSYFPLCLCTLLYENLFEYLNIIIPLNLKNLEIIYINTTTK